MYQTEKLKVVAKVVAVIMILEVDKTLAIDIFAGVLNMIDSKQTLVIVREVISAHMIYIEKKSGIAQNVTENDKMAELKIKWNPIEERIRNKLKKEKELITRSTYNLDEL